MDRKLVERLKCLTLLPEETFLKVSHYQEWLERQRILILNVQKISFFMVFRSRSGLNSNLLPPVNFIYQAAFVEKLRLQPYTVVQIINDFAFSISRLRSNRSFPLRENNTSQQTGQADTLIEDEYLSFGTRYLIVNISSCLQVGKINNLLIAQ
ncbi:hypothetical protein RUM43_009412 [Polyplax serrata]|uniref:Uncharacterized protein n=1 Tax=Polyplax serrata TaxID=468196 RepID=A0AAN8NPI0_POLSC